MDVTRVEHLKVGGEIGGAAVRATIASTASGGFFGRRSAVPSALPMRCHSVGSGAVAQVMQIGWPALVCRSAAAELRAWGMVQSFRIRARA